MKWNKLIARQAREKVELFLSCSDRGLTMTEAAHELGITRQQVYQFCRANCIKFEKKDNC